MDNKTESIKKALNLAIRYLSYQPRTVYEMKKYMEKKRVSNNDIGEAIKILKENNYLNDHDLAKLFIINRINNKPKSKFAFHYELKKKGINGTIIDDILMKYDDQELAIKAIRPKFKQWQNFDNEKFKKKISNYLRYRGFNYDIILSTLNYMIELRNQIKEE